MTSPKRRRLPRVASLKERGVRMCASCRVRLPKEEMIRLVTDSDGGVWVDPYLKAPGRGAHLCYDNDCIANVIKKRSLEQSFKRKLLPLSKDVLYSRLKDAQHTKIINLLSLGKRSGRSISGLNVLQSSVDQLYVVIFAHDGAEQSQKKLTARLKCPLLVYGESKLLGSTQGKAKRVAIGVKDQTLATQIIKEIHRHQVFGCVR